MTETAQELVARPMMTAVFECDLRAVDGNPFHKDTPFGRAVILALGDEIARLQSEIDAALARETAAAERGARLREALLWIEGYAGMDPRSSFDRMIAKRARAALGDQP